MGILSLAYIEEYYKEELHGTLHLVSCTNIIDEDYFMTMHRSSLPRLNHKNTQASPDELSYSILWTTWIMQPIKVFFFLEWLLKCLDIKFSTILHEIWVLTLLQVILPLPWFCPSLISLFVFINSKIRLTCVRSNIIFYLKIIWYLYVINLYLIHPNYICK